ncbi:Protein LURP-one-related 15 [Linum perenne]
MAGGKRPSPIPAKSEYRPLEHPVVVISPNFLAQYPVELTVTVGKVNTVTDFNGAVIFRMKSSRLSPHHRRKLIDASGKVLVSLSQKIFTLHRRWQSFIGDSKDLMFNVKKSSMLQQEAKLDVFLAGNAREKDPDFRIKGNYKESSCIIYLENTNKIVARVKLWFMYRDRDMKTKSFKVTINPNVDYAFIVSLAMVTIKEINAYRKIDEYNQYNQTSQIIGGAVAS